MSSFETAVKTVFRHEGGLTDDRDDPGGITNHGITLDVLRHEGAAGDVDGDGDIDGEDIRLLSIDRAAEIYNRQWWARYGYGRIENQAVATKVFDLAVNFGPGQAHRIAQRALRAVGPAVTVDGLLGPITVAALNQADALPLLAALRCEAAGVYRMIAAKKPPLYKFLAGWLNRAYS